MLESAHSLFRGVDFHNDLHLYYGVSDLRAYLLDKVRSVEVSVPRIRHSYGVQCDQVDANPTDHLLGSHSKMRHAPNKP